jgi:hypothetical protein
MMLVAGSAKSGTGCGGHGDSLLRLKLLNNIYLEGVFSTGADCLIGPFFLYLIVSAYLQTRCKYYIRIYNDSTLSPNPEDQHFSLFLIPFY